MSNERLYSEAEAVEIIQRALNHPESDTPAGGMTKNDLWRIAEEAGATREQFDSAMAVTISKAPLSGWKGSSGTVNHACMIEGELTPDDFVLVEEQIPNTFGGKIVSQEGHTMKVRLDLSSAIVVAIVASRKGQTYVRVGATYQMAILAGIVLWFLIAGVGLVSLIGNHSQSAWLLFILAPIAGLCLGMLLARKARQKGREFFELLTRLVSDVIAQGAVGSSLAVGHGLGTQRNGESVTLHQDV